jgi:hypothetical protein
MELIEVAYLSKIYYHPKIQDSSINLTTEFRTGLFHSRSGLSFHDVRAKFYENPLLSLKVIIR